MAQTKTTDSNIASDDIAAQIEALKADIAGLTGAMADLGRAKGSEARQYAESKAGEAKARAQEGAAFVRGQAEDAYGKANNFVHEKPAAALGIAAGLGFVIGHMMARK
ncbi:DUF883 domain-containing protein [Vannielia sp.]|uniref:DUF883 family protein n=1 Tax=Vannielia sp. TaxID=2813045 RepID=UPI002628AA73|nr:DUF883 domain-containing protein [Vannielia sp.]MDF1872492.1 DUF883 domain-containing protein [Vannielia sp.]